MSENWAIAMVGFVLTVMATILGIIANQLSKINDSLQLYVRKDQCDKDMGVHCDRLNDLEDMSQKLSERMTGLETKVALFHSSIDVGGKL